MNEDICRNVDKNLHMREMWGRERRQGKRIVLTHNRILFFLFCYIRKVRYTVKLKTSGSVAGGTDLSLASHRLWQSCHVIWYKEHRRECFREHCGESGIQHYRSWRIYWQLCLPAMVTKTTIRTCCSCLWLNTPLSLGIACKITFWSINFQLLISWCLWCACYIDLR